MQFGLVLVSMCHLLLSSIISSLYDVSECVLESVAEYISMCYIARQIGGRIYLVYEYISVHLLNLTGALSLY